MPQSTGAPELLRASGAKDAEAGVEQLYEGHVFVQGGVVVDVNLYL
jgi:hypothetical protein